MAPANKTRRIVSVWVLVLVLAFLVTIPVNVKMARYARAVRDQRPETYIEMAETLAHHGDYQGALKFWQEANRRAPDNLRVRAALAEIYYGSQKWEDALAVYREVIERGSREKGVYLNSLWCLVQLGRYKEALEFANLCIDDGITHPELYRRASEACFRGRMYKESIPFYQTALEFYRNDLYLMEHLKQVYQALGEKEKARALDAQIAQLQAGSGASSAGKKP
jgi:tetratricopeptide (TPR) repeat protein